MKNKQLILLFSTFIFLVLSYNFYLSKSTLKIQSQKNLKEYESLFSSYKAFNILNNSREKINQYIKNDLQNDENLKIGEFTIEEKNHLILLGYEANDIRLINIFINKIFNQPFNIVSFEMKSNKAIIEIKL